MVTDSKQRSLREIRLGVGSLKDIEQTIRIETIGSHNITCTPSSAAENNRKADGFTASTGVEAPYEESGT